MNFTALTAQPTDPILSLIDAFKADERAEKIDVGVGVYRDEHGATPVMRAVKEAEDCLLSQQASKSYLGVDEIAASWQRSRRSFWAALRCGTPRPRCRRSAEPAPSKLPLNCWCARRRRVRSGWRHRLGPITTPSFAAPACACAPSDMPMAVGRCSTPRRSEPRLTRPWLVTWWCCTAAATTHRDRSGSGSMVTHRVTSGSAQPPPDHRHGVPWSGRRSR